MGFNYALEKKKFDTQWALKHKAYRKAGMSPADIQTIKDFDWEVFLSERRFRMHTQPLPSESISDSDEDGMSGLFKKFDSLKVTFSESDFSDRYSWVETVEDELMSAMLKTLSASDLELLTLMVIDGFSQADIARMDGCARNTVNKKLARIKKVLREG
ncbi:MAG: sigma factor-like helix-turn-helix DNA-binding protein [Oscillospiraceae bacterium]|nr:sigma factor-like helix-turn-helix DNA-binding protein [Oscillospiraceae bacterium]